MVTLIGLLILLVAGLIVRYNMIDDGDAYAVDPALLQTKAKPDTAGNYLKSLEGYEETDIKAKASKEKESSKNVVAVQTEATEEDISSEIDSAIDTAKKIDSYVDNLEHYDKAHKQKPQTETVEKTKDTQTIKKGADPMSDIVNDIDSIIDTAGE